MFRTTHPFEVLVPAATHALPLLHLLLRKHEPLLQYRRLALHLLQEQGAARCGVGGGGGGQAGRAVSAGERARAEPQTIGTPPPKHQAQPPGGWAGGWAGIAQQRQHGDPPAW